MNILLQDSSSFQPYKYGGKEFVETHGLDMYDNHARWYYATIMRTITLDPMAEQYYSISPYAWCGNNPVRNVDPTGMDIWEINNEGRIINRIEDKTQDAFYMVALDAEGNYQRTYTTDENGNKQYNSVSFKYGTVESQRSISYSPDGKTTDTYDVYQVRGDENGTKLFEFLGEHVTGSKTHVEISEAKTGIAGKHGLNFITTSHTRNSEFGMSHLFTSQLYNGYTIRELNHTHPNGRGTPSGQSEIPRWGDKGFGSFYLSSL